MHFFVANVASINCLKTAGAYSPPNRKHVHNRPYCEDGDDMVLFYCKHGSP